MEDEEDVEMEDMENVIKTIKKVNPKVWTILTILCLFLLFYQLGYVVGYREAKTMAIDYYETKIDYYCYCQDQMNLVTDNPLNMPKIEIDFDIK